ncbi:DUF7224 domain-containing protein [Streptomyces sp. SYSU K217416]
MLLRTLLRTSSASVGLPLVVLFVLAALGDDLTSSVTDHYWPSVTGSASFALAFISTGCAALGAWEGARLKKGRVFTQTTVRSPLAITVPVLAPVVATGMVGMLAALLVAANAADVGLGLPDIGVLTVELLLLSANTLAGYLIGRRWSAVISVPVTVVAAFIANAYPVSWDIMWPRHLVGGGLDNCCAVDQVLDTRGVWSAAVFALALSLAAALVIQLQASRLALTAAVVLVAIGTGAGALFARDLSADPVRDRADTELVCKKGAAARLCLWPEVRDSDTVRSEAQKVLGRLQDAGVATPSAFTMAARPRQDEAKLAILPGDGAAYVPAGVVAGLVPEPPACAADDDYPAGAASEPVAAWLLLTAGSPAEMVRTMVAPEAAALAEKVAQQPRATQLSWYERNFEAMGTCTGKPLLSLAKETS